MIIKLDIKNLEDILYIENNCFSTPLSEQNLHDALLNDKYCFFGHFDNDKLVGYGSVFIVANEAYINNIAVLKEYRQKGIAACIINEIIKISNKCEFISLEVRESNEPAIKLYNKFGFNKVAIRKNYYREPIENAIIMTKYLEN